MRSAEYLLASILSNHPEMVRVVQLEDRLFSERLPALVVQAARAVGSEHPLAQVEWMTTQGANVDVDQFFELRELHKGEPKAGELQRLERQLRAELARRTGVQKLESRALSLKHATDEDAIQAEISAAGADLLNLTEMLTSDKEPDGIAIRQRSLKKARTPYFPCGVKAIDDAVGGMKHGHFWVINAGYKQNKSRTAVNLSLNQLLAGNSVAYVTLEDDDESFNHMMMGCYGDFDAKYLEDPDLLDRHLAEGKIDEDVRRITLAKIEKADAWLADTGKQWRVYDTGHGVNDWKRIPALILRDKLRYDADLVVLDHANAWSSEYEDLAAISQMVRQTALEANVCVLVLTQMSNYGIRGNLSESELGTKGAGNFGADCHVGLELKYRQEWLSSGTGRYAKNEFVSELDIFLKTVRKGERIHVYANVAPRSGRFLDFYETSKFPAEETENPRPRGKSARQ